MIRYNSCGLLCVVIFLLHWTSEDAFVTRAECDQATSKVDACLQPFIQYLDDGVAILKDANDTFIGIVCWKYEVSSSCIAPYMFHCPDVRRKLITLLDDFEYACNAQRKGNWPFMPTAPPSEKEDIDLLSEEEKRINTRDNLLKASAAAFATLLLILACVITDCVSRKRIRDRIKKASAGTQVDAVAAPQVNTVDETDKKPPLDEKQEPTDERAPLTKKV